MKINKVQSTLVLLLLLLKKVDAQLGILDWIVDLACWIPFLKPADCNKCAGKDCGQGGPGGPDQPIGSTGKLPSTINWRTVANNNRTIPESSNRSFNSYNPPSVNTNGLVVFRARSKGHQGGPYSGIYMTDGKEGGKTNEIWRAADRNLQVPQPNNLGTTFTEFPSFPRIAPHAAIIATRGNHQPVFNYTEPEGEESEGEEPEEDSSRAGTTGVYVRTEDNLFVGAAKLGNVPDWTDRWQVPVGSEGIAYDVFPGAPSVTDEMIIAFKGNFNDGDAKTGVFFRQLMDEEFGGTEPIQHIASSNTEVPNVEGTTCPPGTKFGSTAPPSASGDTVVFAGFDNETDPSCGGIYLAPLEPNPDLKPLVSIGDEVPTVQGETLTHIGEGLSYDGRFIAFWGSWVPDDNKNIRVFCPTTGNKDRRFYCNETSFQDTEGRYYQDRTVPKNQGIFVYDTNPGRLFLIARTGDSENEFDDFLFWKFTGAPPGAGSDGHGGGTDAEPPRFRSSAFISVNGDQANGVIMFKARIGAIDGIYYKNRGNDWSGTPSVMATTDMEGTVFDPKAVIPEGYEETGDPMLVSEVSMEREALRGRYVVLTLRFGAKATPLLPEGDDDGGGGSDNGHDTVDEFAGIYIANVPSG